MAERLTKKIGNDLYIGKHCDDCPESIEYCGECSYVQSIKNQLGKLEDILEKYGIESVEELKDALENKIEDISNPFLQGYVRAFFKDRLQYVEFERDIWKRACELASETLKQVMGKPLWIGGNIPTPEVKDSDYFYQQAKKDGDSI